MADAVISAVSERIIAIIEEQIRKEVNLVRGVEKEVLNLSDELKTIRNVLDDAESRGYKEKSVKDWLKKLEDASYEVDDVLDEWNFAILNLQMEQSNAAVASKHKVCFSLPSCCLCFKKVAIRHDIANKIINVKAKLDLILAEKDRYNFVTSQPTNYDPWSGSWRAQSTSLIDLAQVHGRVFDRDNIVSKLMPNGGSQEEEELGLRSLFIVGVGGLGKTTLAQLVYNDSRVKNCFELRIWICVSDPFDEVGIVKGIIESIEKGSSPNTNQLDILFKCLIDSISGKKFLLVLDDVWTECYTKWEPLKNSLKYGGAGSKILVTTRNERIAKVIDSTENDIYHLGQLSDEECWLLLCRMALFGRSEEEFEKFQDIGKKIAIKCKGLPLAAKALGSLLRFKNSLEEWEDVLNNELWQLEKVELELFPHLLLSYNELSPTLKRCFSYCAIFPKDLQIEVEKLIGNWMALGYLGSNIGHMELEGRHYFDMLATRSLFQDFEKYDLDGKIFRCKMHDIVHDFAQFLRKNARVETTGMKTTCQTCNPLLVSHVKEYRSLFCRGYEPPPNLCNCLTSLRVLGITGGSLHSIPLGMENLIHLRWLDLSLNDLSKADLKTIFQLYNLQTLCLQYCMLQEIPREIGNLIHLIHLNLAENEFLELPESICDLHELRTLNVDHCYNLRRLPQRIHRLVNLKNLFNSCTETLNQFPHGLAQLTGLRTLSEFRGGISDWRKMGWLKNLNRLTGSLKLHVRLLLTDDLEDVVEDAREAELRKKMHIQKLEITFEDEKLEKIFDEHMDIEKELCVRMDVMDALEPHPKLRELIIEGYNGSKLPGWIASPLNQLRCIKLYGFNYLSSLPPFGKLPCLEEIYMAEMDRLQYVGREFLGITTTSARDMDIESSSSSVAAHVLLSGFPKLKKLTFYNCHEWKEWEDITAEEEEDEEESAAVSLMPCLTKLTIERCVGLTTLPHRLLRKASSLEELDICRSTRLQQRYKNKDGSAWKSISQNNPRLQLNLS